LSVLRSDNLACDVNDAPLPSHELRGFGRGRGSGDKLWWSGQLPKGQAHPDLVLLAIP